MPPISTRCDRTAAWAALAGHYEAHGRELDLREAFARDPQRFAALSFEAPEVFADLSKNLVDTATMRFLADLARECGVEASPVSVVGADQYRGLVRRIKDALVEPLPHQPLQAILNAHPAAAEIYENLHYDTSGLSRSTLERSVATEMLATQLIHKVARRA